TGLVPLPCLVVSETKPADVETARQRLGADLLDRLDGLTGAVASSRRALNGGGGVQVVPGDLIQTLLFYERHERGIGDHFAFVVLDEQVVQVLCKAPELRPGLDEDLVEKVETNESLLPGAAD